MSVTNLALNHLQEAVSAVELLATRTDPAAIKEAKERYLYASESLNVLLSNQPAPITECSVQELESEQYRLKEEILQKEQTLSTLAELAQDLVSALERWDQWDLEPRARQVAPALETDDTKSVAETESIASDIELK